MTADDRAGPPSEPCVISIDADSLLQDTVDGLGLASGRPVVVVVGWADDLPADLHDSVERVFRRAVVPVLDEFGAIVVDGGTDAGVMRIVGRSFAESRSQHRPIGVAPSGKLTQGDEGEDDRACVEPHHVVLAVPGADWGDELPYLVGFVERLAGESGVTVLAVGGGDGTRAELEVAKERAWPILLLEGTGGVADELARQPDPVPEVGVVGISAIAETRRALRWRLSGADLLRDAWTRVSFLDARAKAAQPQYRRIRNAVLFLGVITTAVGVASAFVSEPADELFRYALILLPALSAAMLAWVSRRRKDRRWISTRAAAEAIKREVFRYRARSGPYSGVGRDDFFAKTMAAVDVRLAEEVPASIGGTMFGPWPSPTDGLSHADDELLDSVDSAKYLDYRLKNQIAFHVKGVAVRDRKVTFRLFWVFALSILATFVAAVGSAGSGVVASAAVLAAAAAAAAAWLSYDQVEDEVARNAVTVAGLRAVRNRWLACLPEHREELLPGMVEEAEAVMEAENMEWARSLRQSQTMFGLRESTGPPQ